MNKEEKEKMGGGDVGNTDAHTLSPVNPCVCVQIFMIQSKKKLEAHLLFWLAYFYLLSKFFIVFKC